MSVSTRIGSKARRDGLTVQTWVDPAAWVTVDDAALPEVQRELFLRRKLDIQRYLEGANAAELNTARLCRSKLQTFGATAGSAIEALRQCSVAYIGVYGHNAVTDSLGVVSSDHDRHAY